MVSKVVVVPLVVVFECLLQNELLHQAKLGLRVVVFVVCSIVLLEVLMKKQLEMVVLLRTVEVVLVEVMDPEEPLIDKMV